MKLKMKKYSIRYTVNEVYENKVVHPEMYQYYTVQYNMNAVMEELQQKLCDRIAAGTEVMAVRIVVLNEVVK